LLAIADSLAAFHVGPKLNLAGRLKIPPEPLQRGRLPGISRHSVKDYFRRGLDVGEGNQ